jgi:hypothetical protein
MLISTSNHSARASLVVLAVAFVAGFFAADRWYRANDRAGDRLVDSAGPSASNATNSTVHGQNEVLRAVRALTSAARMSGGPPIGGLPTTVTEYQKLRFQYASVEALHQRLIMTAARKVTTSCRGINKVPTTLSIVLQARFESDHAVLSQPAVTTKAGAPASDDLHDCIVKALGPELRLPAAQGRTLPNYDGDIEFLMNMGASSG